MSASDENQKQILHKQIRNLHNEFERILSFIDSKKHDFFQALAEKQGDAESKNSADVSSEQSSDPADPAQYSEGNTKDNESQQNVHSGKNQEKCFNADPTSSSGDDIEPKRKYVRMFYLMISRFCHPDKINHKSNSNIQEGMFAYIEKCHRQLVLYKLWLVAEQLDLKYQWSDALHSHILRERDQLKTDINDNVNYNVVYLWATAKDDTRKDKLISQYLSQIK